MTIELAAGEPDLAVGWRLKMALEHGKISAQEIAADLGVHRGTVTRWMNVPGVPIRPAYLKQWAAICGVNEDWLIYGPQCHFCGLPSGPVSHPHPLDEIAAARGVKLESADTPMRRQIALAHLTATANPADTCGYPRRILANAA